MPNLNSQACRLLYHLSKRVWELLASLSFKVAKGTNAEICQVMLRGRAISDTGEFGTFLLICPSQRCMSTSQPCFCLSVLLLQAISCATEHLLRWKPRYSDRRQQSFADLFPYVHWNTLCVQVYKLACLTTTFSDSRVSSLQWYKTKMLLVQRPCVMTVWRVESGLSRCCSRKDVPAGEVPHDTGSMTRQIQNGRRSLPILAELVFQILDCWKLLSRLCQGDFQF